jgi:hypothetical protein
MLLDVGLQEDSVKLPGQANKLLVHFSALVLSATNPTLPPLIAGCPRRELVVLRSNWEQDSGDPPPRAATVTAPCRQIGPVGLPMDHQSLLAQQACPACSLMGDGPWTKIGLKHWKNIFHYSEFFI